MGPPLSIGSHGLDTLLAAGGDEPVLGVHWSIVAAGWHRQHPGARSPRNRNHAGADRRHPHNRERPPLPAHRARHPAADRHGPPRAARGMPRRTRRLAHAGSGRTDPERRRGTQLQGSRNPSPISRQGRRRVALLVQKELDSFGQLSTVPGPESTLESLAPQRLPAHVMTTGSPTSPSPNFLAT